MKKFLLMLSLSAALLLPGTAKAYTAIQIAEKGQHVIELFNADNLLNTIPRHSDGNCSFEASGSTLKVKNVYGRGDLNIVISGSRGTISTTGTYYLSNIYNHRLYAQKNTNSDGSTIYIIPMFLYYGSSYTYYTPDYGDSASDATKTVDIDSNGDGTYSLSLNGPFRIVSYDKNNNLTSSFRINYIQFESYVPNVTVTDELHDYLNSTTENRTYNAEFIKKSDTLYEIRNWGKRGQHINLNTDWTYSYQNLECTLDFDNLSATIAPTVCEAYIFSTTQAGRVFLGDKYDGESIYDVEGTIKINDISHTPDNTYSHYWTTNNGTAKTYLGNMQIVFPNCQRVVPSESPSVITEYKNSVVTFNTPVEMTHECDLALEKYGYGIVNGKETIYIKGKITPIKNLALVESYELHVVPGQLSDVRSSDFNHENGHINGYNIEKEEYFSDYEIGAKSAPLRVERAASKAAIKNDGNFTRMIPVEDLPVKSSDGKYSFYVKVNYLPEYNLAPTFHELSYISTPTGIDTAIAESDVTIEAATGTITVSGAENVEVYTLSGAQVYAGGEGSVAVAKGIYVVKADGVVKKVTVK